MPLLLICAIIACEPVEEEEPVVEEVDPPSFVLNEAFSVTTNSALLTATVTGEEIVEVGFVYGTKTPLTENSTKSSPGTKTGDIETTLSGLNENTEYYYAAYAENSDGAFSKSETKSFTTVEEVKLALGDVFEGGIVYYLDASGEHGLLASPVNVTTGTTWQEAFDACYSYELEGNDEWRLPSLNELEDLYAQRETIGGFAEIAYWSSSTEGSNQNLAYGVFFGNGSNAGKSFVYEKTGTYQYSRAIRNF
ncbi:MAG: DUF1566 domain-containing protein [Flavobacteriales bacterium]